jgi:quercetin dioxygenase-like cupin family protein
VLLQAIEGSLAVEIAGQAFQLDPGDLLHIEPGVAHRVSAAEQARLQLTVLMIDSPGPSGVPLVDDLGIAEREGGSGQ